MIQNEITENICSRRSVRKYSNEPISEELVLTMLECAGFAPSGLNNQPWRFIVVDNSGTDNSDDKEIGRRLSEQTHYSDIVSSAPLLIAVFLDTAASYNREKDLMAIGATIQNILLSAHSLGLGAVWLGEILKNKDQVSKILEAPETFELTAVIAVGKPAADLSDSGNAARKALDEIVFKK
ncbi:5,6-dimethylbenzimidazole synthase [Methanimicrococcus hongohii]|uniref:5,6-dimethylbenzimidazole synthase n=1 Tax=Methanimicrococcus hongohii TaxID=3028295 RepID=A0AA96VCP6_9EURY|nr:nitroreductase family protein [Methanimicrococcus sp. Hf6]WNY24347.1 5,6-dimethylbenzimidazole synthase [Methanimicrococcus sp. Hf6]